VYQKGVATRLALENELVADALKYTRDVNELKFQLEEINEAIHEPLLGNR